MDAEALQHIGGLEQGQADHVGIRARHLGDEGTGAALVMTLVEGAQRILTEMATFEEAAVSQSNGDA